MIVNHVRLLIGTGQLFMR